MSSENAGAGFVLTLLAILSTGTCLADNCDQRCRNRTDFHKCNGPVAGYYLKYALPDCKNCSNGKCDTAVEGSDRNCIKSGQNSYRKYGTGLDNCDCAAGLYVEAANLSDVEPGVEPTGVDKYVCETTVIVPPPGG